MPVVFRFRTSAAPREYFSHCPNFRSAAGLVERILIVGVFDGVAERSRRLGSKISVGPILKVSPRYRGGKVTTASTNVTQVRTFKKFTSAIFLRNVWSGGKEF